MVRSARCCEHGFVDVAAYLARIGIDKVPSVDRSGLEALQRAHLTAVPFENLDVFARRGVGTGSVWSVPKIVERNRGGWCFELNGAFGSLLQHLGFEVSLRAATVLVENASGEPSHLTLRVDLDHPYLVDVGFGDSFIRPLRLDTDAIQDGGSGDFSLSKIDGVTTLQQVDAERRLHPQYRFDGRSWLLEEFDPASTRLQSDRSLRWTSSPFATRLIAGGPDRVTLLTDRLKFRRDEVWTEEQVAPEAWEGVLDRWFGLDP